MSSEEKETPCPCNGTGLLHRKGWRQAYTGPARPDPFGVHPAIAAVSAYRTVFSYPCPCPLGQKRKKEEEAKK